MPRKPNFRNDTSLQGEIRRLNKLVQNKQSRLRVNEGLETVGIETVKFKDFSSRKQINQYMDNVNAFLHNKMQFMVENDHGVEFNYSEVKQVERAIGKTNRQKEKLWNDVKDLEFKHSGIGTNLTVEQIADPVLGMGDIRFADLEQIKPKDPRTFTSRKEWENYRDEKMKVHGDGKFLRKLNKLYKENYIKAMENALGNESIHLQKMIKKMPMWKFLMESFTENNAHINFAYDKLTIQARVKELERVWGYTPPKPKGRPKGSKNKKGRKKQ